jgi:hypothetical protein
MESIRSNEHMQNLLTDRPQAEIGKEERFQFDHAAVSSQAIKMVNTMRMDPFAKKVMTLRIMGPMLTGRERTHVSIALELGATIDDVIQAEQYGIKLVEDLMAKVALPDFIEKFNRDTAITNAVKTLGNSADRGIPQ